MGDIFLFILGIRICCIRFYFRNLLAGGKEKIKRNSVQKNFSLGSGALPEAVEARPEAIADAPDSLAAEFAGGLPRLDAMKQTGQGATQFPVEFSLHCEGSYAAALSSGAICSGGYLSVRQTAASHVCPVSSLPRGVSRESAGETSRRT